MPSQLEKIVRWGVFGSLALSAASLGACAGGGANGALSLASAPGVTRYVAASAFSKPGHKVSGLAEGRVRVTATGSSTTSRARVEKIALARAAEYGAEQRHKYFQATPPQVSIQCSDAYMVRRGEKVKVPPSGYTVATVDVTYSASASDPSFQATRDVAKQLKAELASDPALSAPAVIDPEIASQCALKG